MPTERDLLPLPAHLHGHRDRLRIAGFDLVRYSESYARDEAEPIRHPWRDYEYAIHEIHWVDPASGQITIIPNPHYSSEDRLPAWVEYHVSSKKPLESGRLLKNWFTDLAYAALTALVPPFGLTLLGMGALANRANRREHQQREALLARLAPMPKFRDY